MYTPPISSLLLVNWAVSPILCIVPIGQTGLTSLYDLPYVAGQRVNRRSQQACFIIATISNDFKRLKVENRKKQSEC